MRGSKQPGLSASARSSFPKQEAGRSYEPKLVHKVCINLKIPSPAQPFPFNSYYFGPMSVRKSGGQALL